ncbi:hypothetical protein Q0P27_13855, partial [Staphylococcus aureus]|nr:hypothetical protein [Staphylococcus aureus]
RISLTRGIDDPAKREDVDVLVPGGEVIEKPGHTAASFIGVARVLTRRRATEEDGSVAGSAISLSVVGRDSTSASGWSWTVAAFGEGTRE